jgi:hypothetical protein
VLGSAMLWCRVLCGVCVVCCESCKVYGVWCVCVGVACAVCCVLCGVVCVVWWVLCRRWCAVVWCGLAWCDVCGVVCCSSPFSSFILCRRRSKKVALPVHLLRQVILEGLGVTFFASFFRARFWSVFCSILMPKLLEKVVPNDDFFDFLGILLRRLFSDGQKSKNQCFASTKHSF